MLKVDNEYYESVCKTYLKEIDKIESSLEDFKTKCDSIFTDNYFGTALQEVLKEIYINFYNDSKEKLKTLWTAADTAQGEFISDIETDDKM